MGPTKQQALIPVNGEPAKEKAQVIVPSNADIDKVGQEVTAAVFGPVELLRMAISQNADIDKVTKFVEWYEKREAKKAFDAAMKQFKASPPVITKNKQVHYPTKAGGVVDYRHATLDNVCDEVTPAL